jgi:ComF family protein
MRLLSHVVNLIFPTTCNDCDNTVSADAATAYFCKNCWQGIEWFDSPCCPRCGLPYISHPDADNKSYYKQSPTGHICGKCREKPPAFDMAISAGRYAGALSEAIKLFKYKKKIHLGKILTEQALKSNLLKDTMLNFHNPDDLQTVWGCPVYRANKAISAQTLIIPIPLHVKRLREREFNQSSIIASVIGRRFGIPVAANALIRHRHTRPQVELDGKDRKENVVGAFSVEDRALIEGKEIILVDDVYTSGSTVNECARTLKKNGAEKVYVVTIARMVG